MLEIELRQAGVADTYARRSQGAWPGPGQEIPTAIGLESKSQLVCAI